MPPSEANGVSPSLSDAINKLMANPEIISTVASALGNMQAKGEQEPPIQTSEPNEPQPAVQSSGDTHSASAPPDIGALMANLAPIMSGLGGTKGQQKVHERRETDRREALLCALKPYVSEGRREAIDYIIRISQISDILKNIQH